VGQVDREHWYHRASAFPNCRRHTKPEVPDDEAEKIPNGTRSHIQDFAEAGRSFGTVEEIVGTMQTKYPDNGDLTTSLEQARFLVNH
jgi:hypothetical protein